MEANTTSICIDELKSVNIKNFAGLLEMGTWIREYLHDRGRYSERYEEHLNDKFRLKGIDYDVILYVYETPDFKTIPDYFVFMWNYDGHFRRQEVNIITRTIGKNTYYLFICPYSCTACRKLYVTSGGFLYGRRALPKYHYQSQWEHKDLDTRMLRVITKDPFKRYGKEYYRDKITPYGKRCLKYFQQYILPTKEADELQARQERLTPPKPLVLKM